MSILNLFQKNLKYYRKKRGLSQEKLSELIGFGETYITEIETRYKFPKPDTIDIISKVLEIEPYTLFMPLKRNDDGISETVRQNDMSDSNNNAKTVLTLLQDLTVNEKIKILVELSTHIQNDINKL